MSYVILGETLEMRTSDPFPPWVCTECGYILGGRKMSQAQALDKLLEHERARHKNAPVQSMLRPQERAEDRLQGHVNRVLGSDAVKPVLKDGEPEVERLPFELLPPGTWDIEHVISYYRKEATRFSAELAGREIQWERLTALESLKPSKCYVGKELWLGYVVFEFSRSTRVVLECPVEGNAIYVLSGDWKRMIVHSKVYLRTRFPQHWTKIVHRGGWLARVRAAL